MPFFFLFFSSHFYRFGTRGNSFNLLAMAFSLCKRYLCCCSATVSLSLLLLVLYDLVEVGGVVLVSRTPGNHVSDGSASSFGPPVPLPNRTSLAQAIGPVEVGECEYDASFCCIDDCLDDCLDGCLGCRLD